MKKFLGLEFGSTRIKAVLIDEAHRTVSSGVCWPSESTVTTPRKGSSFSRQ